RRESVPLADYTRLQLRKRIYPHGRRRRTRTIVLSERLPAARAGDAAGLDALCPIGRRRTRLGLSHAAPARQRTLDGHRERLRGARHRFLRRHQATGDRLDAVRIPENSPPAISGLAPFCGPYTSEAPSGPQSGFVTSAAATTFVSPSLGSRHDTSIRSRAGSAAPPGRRSLPAASRNRAPSAATMPQPPSF